MQKSPKEYRDKLRLRRHAIGVERRRNMSKIILEKGTPLPKSVDYADIDQEMFNWVDKRLNLSYDGTRLPTYKLYSTQRISEYMQSWDQTDDYGNIIMNFKTITRENNPQKGEITNGYFNIPGHKDFAMFYVPVLQENGTEAYDKYTMKQPFGVNFIYSISIITNKMELLNEMNEKMHYEFNAISCYIFPNGHPMSMTLQDVSDDSEYTIDDRKYYSQTFKVLLKGYIIRKEDFKVERIPSRFVITSFDSDASGIIQRRGKNRKEDEKVKFFEETRDDKETRGFVLSGLESDEKCEVYPAHDLEKPSEIIDEVDDADACCDEEGYGFRHKVMRVVMNFGECDAELSFEMDKEMVLETVETDNIHDFKIFINGELMNLDNEIRFLKDDEITVKISREDPHSPSELVLVGYDPDVVFDNKYLAETSLDEPFDEEEIILENN
jgi:hypothetical protein